MIGDANEITDRLRRLGLPADVAAPLQVALHDADTAADLSAFQRAARRASALAVAWDAYRDALPAGELAGSDLGPELADLAAAADDRWRELRRTEFVARARRENCRWRPRGSVAS